MKNIPFTKATFLLFSTFILSLPLLGQTLEFRIDSTGYMGGHLGFFHTQLHDNILHETDFIFEENNYLRWYAYKMSWQDAFTLLPESTYFVKMTSIDIGDTWTSWVGEPAISTVVDTSTISVPVGTFITFVVKTYLKSAPDSLVFTSYFANNMGRIKSIFRGETGVLTSYTIVGGSGYFPIAVGNWWRSGPQNGVDNESSNFSTYFSLEQNYPNPFNPSTTINYYLRHSGYTQLKVFNMLCQEVTTLVSSFLPAGENSITWNAQGIPSGVYFYRLQSEKYSQTKKLLITK
jgi:hypothetical protein